MFSEDQRLTWRLLIHAFTALKKTQRELVRLLLTYDGRRMTVTEIAGRFCKATTTIHSKCHLS